jgi:hypothetical protein
MRINRIALRNYRGVTEAEVTFPAEGVTIIEGDNEVGKSSLTEALELILDVRDDSKKAQIKAVQPVDRDAGPEVEVDLTTGPYRLVYAKRWLRRPETTLTVETPERAQFTGREAHERVLAILAATLDADLWRALRLEQGTDLQQASFAVSSLGRALDLAAGGEVGGTHEDALWERIVAERDRYWTATGRPGAERVRLADRVAEAVEQVQRVEAELRDLESQADEVARLTAEAAELAATQAELERNEADFTGRADAVAELRRHVEHLAARRDAAVAAHERWDEVAETRAALVARVDERAARLTEAEHRVAQAEPVRVAAEATLAEAVTVRDALAADLRRADDHHRQAVGDAEHRRRQIELSQLTERRDRVVKDQVALEAAEAVLDGVQVDQAALTRIEEAHLELVRAEAAVDAGAARVAATALTELTVEIDGEATVLAPGTTHHVVVSAGTELVVPGVVSLSIQAGAEAQALHGRLHTARLALEHLCADHGVADVREAQAGAAARAEAELNRRHATERIRDDLRDLTLEALDRKIGRHTARIAAFDAERAPQPPLPADLDSAQELVAETEAHLDLLRHRLTDLEAHVAAARSAQGDAAVTNAGLLERVSLDRDDLARARATLAAARAELADQAIDQARQQAELARQQAQTAHTEGQAALRGEDPDTLDGLVANARLARSRGAEAIRLNHDRRQRLRAVLEDRGEQGLSQRLDAALTARDHLQVELERIEARAHAARLLHDTFAARRAEARTRYLAPFRQRIEQLGRLVFGPSLQIALEADLRIASRTLHGVTVAFDQLSTGAREQLGILSRLACAMIVAGETGAPVVFDDALGWTDPQRLTQMAAAIALAGRQCQVIVLTCTPGRFAGIGDAHVVRLPGPGHRVEPGAVDPGPRAAGL